MIAINDTELVLRLQKDDVQAFDTLYWKYHKALYANIFKLIKRDELTQDILQEVFMALWEKRQMLDSTRPVSNWLFSVSYYKTIDFLKRTLKEQLLFKGIEDDSAFPTNLELDLTDSKLKAVEKALNMLSPQKRKVFELCKIQGKSYQEAATQLNISKHTVKEYLSLAIYDIREYITNHSDLLVLLCCSSLLRQI